MDHSKLISFINALPKAEHHLHLDGSPNWHTLHAAEPDSFPEPPPSWDDDFRFVNFEAFEGFIRKYAVPWLTSSDRFGMTANEILNQRIKENVRYAEVSFAALAIERSGVDIDEVALAVKGAVPNGIDVRLFIGLHHRPFENKHDDYLNQILDCPFIDGIDLHGPEQFPLQPWIKEFWKAASSAGKLVKAHAGELTGPEGVREAIEELGVKKIQHGVQAIQDPSVVRLAAEVGASFDVCPISNVKLQATPSMKEHPILELEDAGIKCTINTDDPLIFGNELRDDYLCVANTLGASPTQLAAFAKNSFRTATITADKIQATCEEIDSLLENFLTEENE